MDRWPNFFIVGADKAGTSSLYSYLKEISEIFMSPIKEPNYFSAKTIPQNSQLKPIRDKKKYIDIFKNVSEPTPSISEGVTAEQTSAPLDLDHVKLSVQNSKTGSASMIF